MSKVLSKEKNPEIQTKVINRLIYRVEVGVNKVVIHYYAGQDTIGDVAKATSPNFFVFGGSDRLTNGGPDWDRTSDIVAASDALSQLSYGPINSTHYMSGWEKVKGVDGKI